MAGLFEHFSQQSRMFAPTSSAQRADRHAQSYLAKLADQVGAAAGLAAAAAVPGLLAAVDQHAASVRDILMLGVEGSAAVAGCVLLAGYAKGLLDESATDAAALRAAVGEAWHRADWLTVRILAVCALSRSDDWRRPPAPERSVPDLA